MDWATSAGGYDNDTVQDVMLSSVERRFGDSLPALPVEWLVADNGSAYPAQNDSGEKPTEQRYSGELREDDEARLYRDDAKIG